MAKDFEFVGTIDVKQIHAGLDSIEKRTANIGRKMSSSWTASGETIRRDIKKTGRQVKRTTEETSKLFLNMSKAQRLNLRQGAFALQRFGIQGAAAWGEIFAAAGVAGIAIGAVIVSVLALTKLMKALASAAVNAFKTITKLGIEAAKEYELAGAQFTAVMQGNEKAAEAILNRIKKLSAEVGENLVGVARAFLPEVENLDQLEDILKIAAALARYQPEQGILGARIALQEFLSGETRSLRRRFEVPQADIRRMKEAFELGGVGAAIEELNGFLARTGRSLEDLSDTAEVSFNRLREGWRQLLILYGEPIIDAAKKQMDDLNETLAIHKPLLDAIATAFGEVVGKIVDFIGTNINDFVENIDFDNILEFATALGDSADAFGILLEQLALGETASTGTESAFEVLTLLAFKLEGAFLRAAVAVATLRLEYSKYFKELGDAPVAAERFLEVIEEAGRAGEFIRPGGITGAAIGGITGLASIGQDLLGVGLDAAEGFATAETSLNNLNAAIDDYSERAARLAAGESIFDIIAGDSGVSEDMAEFTLERIDAEKKLSDLLPELTAAEKELADIRGDFSDKASEKRFAIKLRYERAIEDIEERSARRAIEIQTQKLEKLEDLQISYLARFSDIGQDLSDDEEDIARRHGRKTIQIEEDLADDKIKIQEDYLRRLDEINRRFDFDTQEAVRANDAIAFLRIQRRRKFELNEAKIRRDEDIDDSKDKAEKRRQGLKDTLEFELEDARIANTRKLRDLNNWLNAQTDAIDLWEDRQEAKRLLRLEQQTDDAWTAQNRQMADYVNWWLDMNIETNRSATILEDRMEQMRINLTKILSRFPSFRNIIDPELLRSLGLSRMIRGAGEREGLETQIRGGSGGRRAGDRTGAPPEKTTPPTEIQSGTDAQIRQARTLASQQATTLGKSQATFQAIQNADYPTLLAMIQEFERELGGDITSLPPQQQEPPSKDTGYTGEQPRSAGFPGLEEMSHDEALDIAYDLGIKLGMKVKDINTIIRAYSTERLKDQILLWLARLEGRQFGGPVQAGKPVIVGEPLPGGRPNPEIFVPKSDGTIIPLNKLAGLDQDIQATDSFSPTDITLRQMFFSPPFLGGANPQSIDNSRSVNVVNPEVGLGLSPIEIAEIKQLYAQLRLEESLV